MRLARYQTRHEADPHRGAVRSGSRHGTRFVPAMAVLVLCCVYAPARAEPLTWIPGPSPSANHVSEDLELGLRARKVLLQDEVLAGERLGISVRNRTATLWGTASSPILARRAEECVRNLPGLAAVRSELSIDTSRDRQNKENSLPGLLSRTPDGPPPSPDARQVQGALVRRTGQQVPTHNQEFTWRPAGRRPPETLPRSADRLAEHSNMPAKPLKESLPGFPSWDSTRLPGQSALSTLPLPRMRGEGTSPVMPAMKLPLAVPSESAGATPPSLAAESRTRSLVRAVEALRLADDRFRGVLVEVREDRVYLRGTVFRWEHLYELARSISRLPGVRQVHFQDVRAEINP